MMQRCPCDVPYDPSADANCMGTQHSLPALSGQVCVSKVLEHLRLLQQEVHPFLSAVLLHIKRWFQKLEPERWRAVAWLRIQL
jgi:hypothetical protein